MNTITVEIPADVRDNSEKVTDYAFRRDRSLSDYPYHTVWSRDRAIKEVDMFPQLWLTHYRWQDTNPDDQRCRFDLIVNASGMVMSLYHTEYFTRVACCTHDANYAVCYASVTDPEEGVTTIAAPYCDACMIQIRRSALDSGMTVNESERLLVGQHD